MLVEEIENAKGLSGLVIPRLPSARACHFYIDDSIVNRSYTDAADLSNTLGLPAESKPKVVLLFYAEPYPATELGFELLKNYGNIVIAGGMVDQLLPEPPTRDNEYALLFVMNCSVLSENLCTIYIL